MSPDLPENYNRDDDVPFKLPKSTEDASSSDDIVPMRRSDLRANAAKPPDDIITGDFEVVEDNAALPPSRSPVIRDPAAAETLSPEAVTEPRVDDDETGDIPALSDEELRAQDRTAAYEEAYDDEHDVPFKLPRSDDLTQRDEGRIINKMMTMPNQRPNAPTLPGSGGLDPNPDFSRQPAAPTLQTPRVQSSQQAPADARYQRPANYTPQPAQPANVPPPPARRNPAVVTPQQALPSRKRKRQRGFNPGCLAIFVGLFVTFCGGLTCVTVFAGVLASARLGDLLNERVAQLEEYRNFQSTFLYDRDGRALYEVFNEGRRTNVDISQIPQDLINATIATEDDEFYTNIGVDIPATTVALLGYVGLNSATSGGSTITQQLVRNVLFPPDYRSERSATRKAEEILLAISLTGRTSKDDILEMYLNEIYYGNLAYGAQAASQVFFGKDVSELTLGEAALLAGLPQAPAELDPLNPDPAVQTAVEQRWLYVLAQMVDEGYITAEQRNAAINEGLRFDSADVLLRAPHFTVYARSRLEDLMTRLGYSPETIALGGLQVYTTVDTEINDFVQSTARDQISRLTANNVSNGAVVVLTPLTGEIVAMVGSIDYYNDAIDGRVNVTTALRQPGSTVKALNYAAALERGMTPGDIIWDTRTVIGIPGSEAYEPRNYDGTFHGPMRMREALANSYNIPAVQTLRHYVGVDYLINFMQRFGITSLNSDASQYGLSLTLGAAEVSPLELTAAFAALGNPGVYVEPQSILCVLDNEDNIIYQYENGCPQGNFTPATVDETGFGRQVVDPRIAHVISSILSDNAARSIVMGTNSPLNTGALAAAVKTGTTGVQQVKDNWAVGYTRNVAVGVWVGNNNGDPLVNSTGLTGAAPIWNTVITTISGNADMLEEFAVGGQLQANGFGEPPSGLSWQQMCDLDAITDGSVQCTPAIQELLLDSPAGIPNGNGQLEYPQQEQQQPTQDTISIAGPGIYRAMVQSIPEAVANAIQFPVSPGQRQPPPPRYCRVPVELLPSAAGAREQLFLAPPPDANDAVEAEIYARGRNLAFLPSIQCSPDLLTGGSFGPIILTAFISSPSPGQIVPGEGMPILGTAQFSPDQAAFYKIEIRGGQFPNWTTLGQEHYESVVDGQLEFLYVPALQPGDYELRLAIIGHNAEPVQAPYTVPFSVQ